MAFLDLLRRRAEEERLPLRVILKETLQIYSLAAIYGHPTSEQIVFQGGTCLRLIYGGPRYSEDLDFVTSLAPGALSDLFDPVQREMAKLGPLFEGDIYMRIQKSTEEITRWKLYLQSARQSETTSVSLEFAPYPAYTSRMAVLSPPEGMPGLPLVVVRAETAEEIMADKVTAIAGRKYVKGRDVFDLWWLKSRGIEVEAGMVEKKLSDYGVPPERAKENLERLDPGAVREEIEKFLPHRYRVQLCSEEAIAAMIAEVRSMVEGIIP